MDKEIIKKIIEAANQAPSGGNSQPWKFIVKDNIIEIVGMPEKDHPVLNFKNRGTYVALGALIENVEISAKSLGYNAVPRLFLSDNRVQINFEPMGEKNDQVLADVISKRHSNRKPYETTPLKETESSFLFQEAGKFPECQLVVLGGEKIAQVAGSLSADILVFLKNELLHKLLFKEILWNEEEQKEHPGLYIETMEMAPPKSYVFKLFSNWKVAQFANKIKMTQKIYQVNSAKTAASGLIGVIAVENNDGNFIQAGKFLENIWLRATKLDLGLQLLTGTIFLWQQANFGKKDIFSKEELDIINNSYKKLSEVAGIKDKIIALAFRVGKADEPLAVSYKRPPEINWE